MHEHARARCKLAADRFEIRLHGVGGRRVELHLQIAIEEVGEEEA